MPDISPLGSIHIDAPPAEDNGLRKKSVTPEMVHMLDVQCASMEKRARSIMRGRIVSSLFGVLLFTGLFGAFIYDALYGRRPDTGRAIIMCVMALPFIGCIGALFVANVLNSWKLKFWYRTWNRIAYIRGKSSLTNDPLVRTGFAMKSFSQGAAMLNPGLGLGMNDVSRGELSMDVLQHADAAGLIPPPSDKKGVFIDQYFEICAKRSAYASMLTVQKSR